MSTFTPRGEVAHGAVPGTAPLMTGVGRGEGLADGLADALAYELSRDREVLSTPVYGWQDFVVRLAHGVRRAVGVEPRLLATLVVQSPGGPQLRPLLDAPTWVERFLAALQDEGFSGAQAVAARRAFDNFLWGHLWADLGDPASDDRSADDFEDGLEQLVERLERLHASRAQRLPARAR